LQTVERAVAAHTNQAFDTAVEMNVRNARVEQVVEPFYQPENFELQLIRTHDSSLFGCGRRYEEGFNGTDLKLDIFGGVSGRDGSIREVGKTLCVGRCGWRWHKYRAAANAYSKPGIAVRIPSISALLDPEVRGARQVDHFMIINFAVSIDGTETVLLT
jgi:hypothetical protein